MIPSHLAAGQYKTSTTSGSPGRSLVPEPNDAHVTCEKPINVGETLAVAIKDLNEALIALENVNSELGGRLMPVIRPISKDECEPVDTPRDIRRQCSPIVEQLRGFENQIRRQIRGIRIVIDNLEI